MQLYSLLAVALLGPYFGAAACPGPEVNIAPCTCYGDSFTCEGLTSATQLKAVFSQTFPHNNFSRITIRGSSLGQLPDNLFSDKSFGELYLQSSSLSMPLASTLDASRGFLTKLQIYQNSVVDMFNLDVPGEVLVYLRILDSTVYNFEGNPFLPNLVEILIRNNALPHLPVLTRARSVVDFYADENNLNSFLPNVFANFPKLETVSMDYNNLPSSLSDNWFNFNSDSLQHVGLTACNIAYIEPRAFSGLRGGTRVKLDFNALTTMDEDVFRPILDVNQGGVVVGGNPFVCDCSMAWLFRDPELLAKTLSGRCQVPGAGLVQFLNVDVSIFSSC